MPLPEGFGNRFAAAGGPRTATFLPHYPASEEITPLSARAWHAAAMADRMPRLVVDPPSLFSRAFFAVPKSIKGPAGNSVNAVRGYLDMVSRVIVDRRPEAVANVFDADWRPQWRVAPYAGAKAKRAAAPPQLPGQVPVLQEVL